MAISSKPTSKSDWTDGTPANRLEPSVGKKSTGFLSAEKPGFLTFNWVQWVHNQWVEYFESITDFLFSKTAGKNYLINGDFPIWERGTTTGAGTSGINYMADRWRAYSLGSTYNYSRSAFTLGQTDVPNEPTYYTTMVVSSVPGVFNFAILGQYIENVRTLVGKTITISFYAKADSAKDMSVTINQNFGTGGSPSAAVSLLFDKFTLTTSFAKYTATVTLPSISGKTLGTNNDNSLIVDFWFDSGSFYDSINDSLGQQSGTFDISQVQVEEGEEATNFQLRSIGEEFGLCKRFYEKKPYDITGWIFSATTAQAGLFFSKKRTSPTITQTGNWNVRYSGGGGQQSGSTTYTNISDGSGRVIITVAGGLTANEACELFGTAEIDSDF